MCVKNRPPEAELELSEAERDELLRWSRRAKSAQWLALRSQIMLRCAEGMGNVSVAAALDCSTETVGKWRRRFDRAARRADR
jgi:DNA-binding CsgD family transcriptional regulator